jgi:hypothetical protein
MIRRETDAELINRISNMEGVLSNVSYDGRIIDWSPAVDTCVILSNGEDAAQVYEQKARRVWEVMTIFGPSCRGKRALETANAMKEWMLPHLDVAFGSVPNRLRAATWFYRQLGGRPVDIVETPLCLYRANEGETLFEFRA